MRTVRLVTWLIAIGSLIGSPVTFVLLSAMHGTRTGPRSWEIPNEAVAVARLWACLCLILGWLSAEVGLRLTYGRRSSVLVTRVFLYIYVCGMGGLLAMCWLASQMGP